MRQVLCWQQAGIKVKWDLKALKRAEIIMERRFEIPGNTVEFVRDLRYNKYRVFTELQNEQKKKGVWQNDRHCTCKTGIRKISG